MKKNKEKWADHIEVDQQSVVNLARFLHEKYEDYARIFRWETQEKTRVPFEELPPENKKTMIAVARSLIVDYFGDMVVDSYNAGRVSKDE